MLYFSIEFVCFAKLLVYTKIYCWCKAFISKLFQIQQQQQIMFGDEKKNIYRQFLEPNGWRSVHEWTVPTG